MATNSFVRRVISLEESKTRDSATLSLHCGHKISIDGWKVALRMGPLDLTERECITCRDEASLKGDRTWDVVTPFVESIDRSLRSDSERPYVRQQVDDLVKMVCDKLIYECQAWKKGDRSRIAMLRVISAQLRGDTDAEKEANRL